MSRIRVETQGTGAAGASIEQRAKAALIGTGAALSLLTAGSNIAEPLLPNQQWDQPEWPGVLTNAEVHWTGVVYPTSQSLADALDWEVFDEYVPNPYATFTYVTRELDTGADSRKVLQVNVEAALGPDEGGSSMPSAREADWKLAAGAYNGYEPWESARSATFRQAKARITFTAAVGKVVLTKAGVAHKTL